MLELKKVCRTPSSPPRQSPRALTKAAASSSSSAGEANTNTPSGTPSLLPTSTASSFDFEWPPNFIVRSKTSDQQRPWSFLASDDTEAAAGGTLLLHNPPFPIQTLLSDPPAAAPETPPTIRNIIDDWQEEEEDEEDHRSHIATPDLCQLLQALAINPQQPSSPPLQQLLATLSSHLDLCRPPPPIEQRPPAIESIFAALRDQLGRMIVQCGTPIVQGMVGVFRANNSPAAAINRWRNIDVTLPILIPHGELVVGDHPDIQHMTTHYNFSTNLPTDAAAVFSSPVGQLFGDVAPGDAGCVPASMLRTRVAVIHKCPDFLIARVAQLFNACVGSACPVLDSPIQLVCDRVSRCSVPHGNHKAEQLQDCQERIEALVTAATPQDEEKLLRVSSLLWNFANHVNNRLRPLVSEFYSKLPVAALHKRAVPEDLYSTRTGNVGLEFRFAPSKQMKVVLAQRTVPQPSALAIKRVELKGLELSELRLEQDRRMDREWDPLFSDLCNIKVPTKRVLRDERGARLGRAVLVQRSAIHLPDVKIMPSKAASSPWDNKQPRTLEL